MELKEIAMRSFDKSKRRKRTTISDGGEDEQGKMMTTIDELAGDSSFLTVAKGCLEQQAKVLGLFDIKPQQEEKKSYKGFLDDLAKTINDVKEKEENSKAIDTTASSGEEAVEIQKLPPSS